MVRIGLIAALAVVSQVVAGTSHAARAQETGGERILVLPFENSDREPRGIWLGEAAAILVADELNARGLAAIRRSERVQAYEQLNLPVNASLSRATVIKVGHILGASEVIGGSYRLDGDDLIVEAHSIRIDVGRLQPHVEVRGPLKELFTVFDDVAARLSGGAPQTASTQAQPPLAAFESYVKGLMAESAAARVSFLEMAIRDYPAFDRARLALWEVRHEQDDHAGALEAVTPVTGETPAARRARLRAGVSLLEMEQYSEAASAFTGLLDPSIFEHTRPAPVQFAPVLNNLGIVQLRRGASPRSGSAVYYLTRAADADPDEVDYQFNLGYAYVLERNHDAAVYWLREAVRRDVADADAHYLLAIALHALGNGVEASRERDLARQLSSRYEALDAASAPRLADLPPVIERIRSDIGSGRAGVAPAIASSVQREQRDAAAFHLARGQELFDSEQDREAMLELRRAVFLSPYDATAHVLIGRIHLRAGRPADAVEALKIAIWSEETVEARIALAEAYLLGRNTERARAELERALTVEPDSTEARRLLDTIND
jgi:tetratricopeptide (TPR) repeat protein